MAPRLSGKSLNLRIRVLAMFLVVAALLASRVLATGLLSSEPSSPPSLPPCSGLTFSPVATLPNANFGQSYNQSLLPLGGGTPPYTFSVVSGALPSGLALSTDGVISGVAFLNGGFTATVQVADANGCTGTQDLAIMVGASTSTGVNVVDASIARTIWLSAAGDNAANDVLLTGSREWGFNIFNHDSIAFTNPTIRMTSTLTGNGNLVSTNLPISFPFNLVTTAPSLSAFGAPNDANALRDGIRQSTIMGTVTPGFDVTRSVSPLTVPAGGGVQTVTVSVRLVDPRYASTNPNFNVNIFGQCNSVTAPNNLTAGEIYSSGCAGTASATLNFVQFNKLYVFTADIFVPNGGGASISGKPPVTVQSTVYHVPGIVTGPTVTIADNRLGGGAEFTLDQAVEWHPVLDDTYLVSMPGGYAAASTPTITTVQVAQNTNLVYGQQHAVSIFVNSQPNQPATGSYQVTVDNGQPFTIGANVNGATVFNLGSLPVGQHTVKAAYSGDSFYGGSTGSLTFNIAKAPPVFQWGAPTTYNYGQTATANVTFQAGGSLSMPTGNISYQIDGGPQLNAPVINGQASLQIAVLTGGGHNISWTYGGDNNFTASAPQSAQFTVTKSMPSIFLNTAPMTYGGNVQLTISVQGLNGAAAPLGPVSFSVDGGPSSTAQLAVSQFNSSQGTISVQLGQLSGGTHNFSVTYLGDNNYSGTSAQGSTTVSPTGTNLQMQAGPNPASAGALVTVSATVNHPNGTAVPTGTVVFKIDNVPQPTVNVVNGTATFSTSQLATGNRVISAAYSGDTNYSSSTNQTNVTVNPAVAQTTTSLASSANPSTSGFNVTFTAQVNSPAGNVGSGSVTFKDGQTIVGFFGVSPSGQAVFSTSNLTAGSHTITAEYSGSQNFQQPFAASSASLQQQVNAAQLAAGTSTTLTSSLNPSTVGANVIFTAQVTAGQIAVNSGSVVFRDGPQNILATVPVGPTGQAVFNTSTLQQGTRAINASYTGNPSFSPSFASLQPPQQVNAAPVAPSFSQVFPKPAGACICTPVVMNYPSTGTQNWWFLATNSLTLTAFAHAVNSIDPETLRVRIFTLAGVQVGGDILTGYPAGTPNGTETSASLTVPTTANTVYRVEVATPGTVGTQPHYRLKFDGAQQIGQTATTANNFEDGEMLWLMNAAANEAIQMGVSTSAFAPVVSPVMATHAVIQVIDMTAPGVPVPLVDGSGTPLGTTVTVNGGDGSTTGINQTVRIAPAYAAAASTPRVYALSIVEINGHYKITRGSTDTDRGVYLSWMSCDDQPLTINVAAGNTAFAGVVHVVAVNVLAGQEVGELDLAVGTLNGKITSGRYHVTFTAPAGYTVTPSSIDIDVLCDQPTVINLRVDDLTPPVLTLLGSSTMTIEAGSPFTDPGATAFDTAAGNLTSQIQVTGSVNANVPGTYTLNYSVSDGPNTTNTTRTVIVVDTTAPTIVGTPANRTVEATSAAGATVTYTSPTASDAVDGAVSVNCVPASGSTFAIGTSTVTCTAADAAGNSALSSFAITVQDTTAPTIVGTPANRTVEATSAAGATVSYTSPTASDAVDGAVSVNCVPASGLTFAIGTSTVTCTATDAAGNSASSSFTVTVRDTTAPAIVGTPANQTVEATSAAGATVLYTSPTATDGVDGGVSVNCVPASGATFPIGTSTVTCTATDASGNSASSSFTVTVRDTTAPTIVGTPANRTVEVTSGTGATVTYTSPTASDAVDGTVSVNCVPASGSTFVIGTSTVTCTATDAAGNSASSSFTVTVRYNICLLYEATKTHQSGSTIPIKIQLCDAAGNNLTSASLVVHATAVYRVSTETSGPAAAAGNANPDNDFRVVNSPTSYMFNLRTTGLASGTYRLMFVVGADPTPYSVPFQIR